MMRAAENGDVTMEWNPLNQSDVKQAKEQFEKFMAEGCTIYRLSMTEKAYVPIRIFDPKFAELLISHPIVEKEEGE